MTIYTRCTYIIYYNSLFHYNNFVRTYYFMNKLNVKRKHKE